MYIYFFERKKAPFETVFDLFSKEIWVKKKKNIWCLLCLNTRFWKKCDRIITTIHKRKFQCCANRNICLELSFIFKVNSLSRSKIKQYAYINIMKSRKHMIKEITFKEERNKFRLLINFRLIWDIRHSLVFHLCPDHNL